MSTLKEHDSDHLAEQLHSTAIRLLRAVRRADHSSGSTAPRLSALSVIVYSGSITLGDLAEAEQVRPPTMTRIVNALEEQQLVVKAKDTKDGRIIRIAATTKGKKLLLQGRARRVRLLSEQLQLLGVDEQTRLAAALKTLQHVVELIRE
ncbi:MarR family winged helix-turn-helix transcriptional regulator [Granulicella sibirica]|uniref:MarR family winged helix-turn-helix transcriptional regulator n=1 Tax=Granulicella sibirica TaxID=2479048 RepID=UPI00100872FD|nr:MarR family transcriptional regulator [Granulicella sibirica]